MVEGLRRFPDVEGPDLVAENAADRLLLSLAAPFAGSLADGELAIVGDDFGAVTLGAVADLGVPAPRVHQDPILAERALAANAERFGVPATWRSVDLGPSLVERARVVLLRLPKSLDALDEIAATIAGSAADDVVVYAAGMSKHMTPGQNDVLLRHFADVSAGRGVGKARALTARSPRPGARTDWPHREHHADLGLWVCAHGGVFAGTRVDIGTRFLLGHIDRMAPGARTAIDLGCGTGVVASVLAERRPGLRVVATDQSAAAVLSARATAEANGVIERIDVVRDDGLGAAPSASADLIVLNPPFHTGHTVNDGLAARLVRDAARVLTPGGELWTVFNSHLAYAPELRRIVGPTDQVDRNAKFTVTRSRAAG